VNTGIGSKELNVLQSPETLQKISQWRAKQEAGTMTPEDWRDAMLDLREARRGAAQASARAKRAPVDVNAMKESLKALRKAP